MKRLELIPEGWPCKLSECRPGLFVWEGNVGFKSEYVDNQGFPGAYNEAGEYHTAAKLNSVVQPVNPKWTDEAP